ncbi:hypothetical protein BOSEA1005_21659 [Hyphomicrobiales bacterium]|nr:hypothetical protein BOSEA1005_21659 [Hyphomicrobiales bacterium]CAI0346117.1 hypothetical protein BO1005MUT1_470275 [Hyphomicrobiales bacterium]
MMPVNSRPSEASRVIVQVELRTSTSTSPDWSAVKRSLAESGMNFTLFGSLKTAAATARQSSTSRPFQLPWASGTPKPARPVLEPQFRVPRCLTCASVAWAEAAVAEIARPRPAARAAATNFFIDTLPVKTMFPARAGRHPGVAAGSIFAARFTLARVRRPLLESIARATHERQATAIRPWRPLSTAYITCEFVGARSSPAAFSRPSRAFS